MISESAPSSHYLINNGKGVRAGFTRSLQTNTRFDIYRRPLVYVDGPLLSAGRVLVPYLCHRSMQVAVHDANNASLAEPPQADIWCGKGDL